MMLKMMRLQNPYVLQCLFCENLLKHSKKKKTTILAPNPSLGTLRPDPSLDPPRSSRSFPKSPRPPADAVRSHSNVQALRFQPSPCLLTLNPKSSLCPKP